MILPLFIPLSVIILIEVILWVLYNDTKQNAAKFGGNFNRRLLKFQELFGMRADGKNFLCQISDDLNRSSVTNNGGMAGMGNRLEEGDILGAAAIFGIKVAIEGVASVVGKASKAVFRGTRQAISDDGPKTEEQIRWEDLVRKDVIKFLEFRKKLKGIQRWMQGVFWIGIIATFLVTANVLIAGYYAV